MRFFIKGEGVGGTNKFLTRLFLGLTLLSIFVISLVLQNTGNTFYAAYEDDSNWTDNTKLEFTIGNEIGPDATYTNRDCFDTEFKIQKYEYLWRIKDWIPSEDEIIQVCALQTPLGEVAQTPGGAYIKFLGSTYAQQIFNGVSGINAVPVPGQRSLLVGGGVNGSLHHNHKTYLFYNLLGVGESVIYGGERRFKINSYPSAFLDSNGAALPIYSVALSRNGEWMVAVVKDVLARIHLSTKTIQTFAKSRAGSGTFYNFAISNDGRHVFVQPTAKFSGTPQVYDLDRCEINQSYSISDEIVAGCVGRDITRDLQSGIEGFQSLTGMRFSYDGQKLSGVVRYRKPLDTNWPSGLKYISINPSGYVQLEVEYLGLGDSFSSGEGDGWISDWYEPSTNTDDNNCHLSRRSYPYLVAIQLGLHSGVNKTPPPNSPFHSVACSGAKIVDIIDTTNYYNTSSQAYGKEDEAYDQEIYSNFLAGYRAQLNFIQNYNPYAITISVIGNDLGFSSKLKRCLSFGTCYDSFEERLEVLKEVENKFSVLVSLYKRLSNESHDTKIYILGYPQLISDQDNCGANVWLNPKERDFSRGLVHYLNATIKAAAENSGVVYVDVENAFHRRQLCDNNSEPLAVNGISVGDDIGPLGMQVIGNESYHPNSVGHVLLAERVMQQTEGLTKAMSEPNPSKRAPDPLSQEFSDFLNVDKENRQTYALIYEQKLGNDVIIPGIEQSTAIEAPGTGQFEGVLTSEPVSLGLFRPDENGIINFTYTIPEGTPAGFHTLHLYGKNAAQEAIDIYKTIYVAASASDFDGDGILNPEDSCDAFEPSGQDRDLDGIDDACDSFMNELPPDPEPEPQPEIVPREPVSDPKPLENNPETEATDVPLPEADRPSNPSNTNSPQLFITSASPRNSTDGQSTAATPIQTSPSQPQVAGAQTSNALPPDNYSSGSQTSAGSLSMSQMLITVLLAGSVLGAFYIYKLRRNKR